jgi:hypothetical protein
MDQLKYPGTDVSEVGIRVKADKPGEAKVKQISGRIKFIERISPGNLPKAIQLASGKNQNDPGLPGERPARIIFYLPHYYQKYSLNRTFTCTLAPLSETLYVFSSV